MPGMIQPSIAVVINDLIFLTKIQATARSFGLLTHHLASADDLGAVLTALRPRAVIYDLNTANGDLAASMAAIAAMSDRPAMLGFFSHVDEALAARARQAGIDEVMPRSRFNLELPRIMERCAVSPRAAATDAPSSPA